jgi:hypothetical protein
MKQLDARTLITKGHVGTLNSLVRTLDGGKNVNARVCRAQQIMKALGAEVGYESYHAVLRDFGPGIEMTIEVMPDELGVGVSPVAAAFAVAYMVSPEEIRKFYEDLRDGRAGNCVVGGLLHRYLTVDIKKKPKKSRILFYKINDALDQFLTGPRGIGRFFPSPDSFLLFLRSMDKTHPKGLVRPFLKGFQS